MKMRTSLAVAFAAVMGTALTAKALMIALPPMPQRVASATAAYVGKVSDVGEKAVEAALYKGDSRQMKIATVKISETLLGKGAREVKVGFLLPDMGGGPIGRPIRPGLGRGFGPQLAKDQEGLFMLHKHPTMKDVYVFADFQGFVGKKDNPGFDGELKGIKESAKRLADPMKGLKAKDVNERFQTAALLLTRYKSPVPGSESKMEDVPAAQSKLILEAIADADWNPRVGRFDQFNPQNMFFRLGLTPADGWKPDRGRFDPEAAKKWLKDNAGKYKLKRYVREEGGVSEEPGASPE